MKTLTQVMILKGYDVLHMPDPVQLVTEQYNALFSDAAFPDKVLSMENHVLGAYPTGAVVLFLQRDLDYTPLARVFSRVFHIPVLNVFSCNDLFWGYTLWEEGEQTGAFSPLPHYFDAEVSPEECAWLAGNPEYLAHVFDCPKEKLERYLVNWEEEQPDGRKGKAYESDLYEYGPDQMMDFMGALDFPFPVKTFTDFLVPMFFGPDEDDQDDEDEEDDDVDETDNEDVSEKKNSVYHFQVNLGGMLDVLSNHLYKSPDVFLRELLQNGVDAITLRQKENPNWNAGKISIALTEGKRMAFMDNGAGLTEEGIHQFLAVIGQSSKTQLIDGRIPEDFIGRFGIGLLSCFMVSDSIVVQTRPARGGDAHIWKGLPDGTYTLKPLSDCPVGTTVILEAKPGSEHYFKRGKVEELVRYYGLALPVPVVFQGELTRLNQIPENFSETTQAQLLDFGTWLFGEHFLDAIPIHTDHLDGVAYVLPYETVATVKNGHRIYLKQMLLTEQGETLLPEWAFFLRCFLNTKHLRPTASREDFYEDKELELARKEFAGAISDYLTDLATYEPNKLQEIVQIHFKALKSIAVWNDELFRLFIDYLPFETSEGRKTGAVLKKAQNASYVGSVDKFRQLKPIFLAQGKLLVCAGYTNDRELLQKLRALYDVSLTPLNEEELDTALEDPSAKDRNLCAALLRAADRGLAEFDCCAEIKCFHPADLPALYSVSEEVLFLRDIQSAREVSTDIFSNALTSLLDSVEDKPKATLFLNWNNSLIQRLCTKRDASLLTSVARIIYVQSLMAGGYPLQGKELQVMSGELLNLVEHSLGE